MNEYTFIVPGTLPGLNKVIQANRTNKYAGAALKKQTEEYISLYIKSQHVPNFERIMLEFKWVEPNMKRDLDNIASARKFVLDSLVECGIIPNDGWKNVKGFSDSFEVDKYNPHVEIKIMEVTNE